MSLSFDPSKRMYKHNLLMLNAALSTIKLSEIEIKDIQDYVVTRQTFNKGELNSITYDYGFDRIDLLCKQRVGKELHIFQIDTAALPKTANEDLDSQVFFQLWRKEHPDRLIHQMIRLSYEHAIAFIFLHYEKNEINKIKGEETKTKEEDEKRKKEEEEERQKKEEEERKRKEEEERKKKEEEDHKKAEELISKGNEEFQKKNYDEAISLYQEAINIYPKEKIECYLNLAKCYLEKKDYIKSIELCKYICENTNDFSRRATAFGILGYSFRAQNKLDEALKAFEFSQMINNDPIIKKLI